MKQKTQLVLSFKRCAPCVNNFFEIFCQSTCNPIQTKFLKVLTSSPSDPKYSGDPKKLKVDSLAYSINLTDAKQFFDSCSQTYSAPLQQSFLNMFGSSTYATQLLTNFGIMSPFTIDFHFFDNERTFHLVGDNYTEEDIPRTNEPVQIDFTNCNETTRYGTCRCSQCETLDCPYVPGVDEPLTCTIFGLFSCSSVVIFIIYDLLLILSVVFFIRYLRKRRRNAGKLIELNFRLSTSFCKLIHFIFLSLTNRR